MSHRHANISILLAMCFACAWGADYKWSLRGLSGPEREAALRAAHARSAERLQRLCFANGGVYIKLGQHIAQLVRFMFVSCACMPLSMCMCMPIPDFGKAGLEGKAEPCCTRSSGTKCPAQ